MIRKLIHIDMDAFYASVEQRDHPELRGKALAVGFAREARGVVAAASYEARVFGVRSAMPAARALRLCPSLQFIAPNFAKYSEVSAQMREILEEYTELIEPVSLDECYLDVTENKQGLQYATQVAQLLRRRIRQELGLTASAGVAPVKFVAKLASDQRKPDGLTVVPPERVLSFIHPLAVERLWGVGPVTQRRLHAMGLHRIGDVARCDRFELAKQLGKQGLWLHQLACGEDERPVWPERERKSRGAEQTFFEDLHRRDEVVQVLDGLLEEVFGAVLRQQEQPRCLTVKVRYDDFSTVSRAMTTPTAIDTLSAARRYVQELLARTEVGRRPVRLVGVSFSSFQRPGPQLQLPL
ncbi:MAG: DNA polymerase IV [Myxococcota bacterium]|jgi:DNA polymerase-4|nr:DNA polymerase IV [Myxococcota bacterium]